MARKASAGVKRTAASRVRDEQRAAASAATIDPKANHLILGPADILDEAITVTHPKDGKCRNINLRPSPSIAPFIEGIDPPGGYGPVTGEKDQTFKFRVRFHGMPCKPELQIYTGTLDVVCDERAIARKDVRITVPACPPTGLVYCAKFVCGVQPDCECTSVQPGQYATHISIHNYGTKEVAIDKRFIPLVLAGAPVGREPNVVGSRAEDRIILPPQTAASDDCCRIAALLFGGEPSSTTPITIGFLEITANGPVAVTATYTSTGLEPAGVSIEVTQVAPHKG